ncbi:P-loop ATPase, Sll1717 family [Sphingopyxis sp. R3-92]|uniref:P-loop ATPase, Sll1717 family n=1 Tax=Sphingopyxis sp. R3-92 TaxID=3158553 RepID=UPI003EE6770B
MTPEAFDQIRKWKLEANEENSSRYFYRLPELADLEAGELCFVIGRKGSGKTAIAAHISERASFDRFFANLSFKNFPFNLLYELSDTRFPVSSQYTTLWKYAIYVSIASLMAQNEAISEKTKNQLSSSFSQSFSEAIGNAKRHSGSSSVNVNLAGILTLDFGKDPAERSLNLSVSERVEILERLISENIDESEYFITFDELDDDYESILGREDRGSYFELMAGLFKAVMDVRKSFKGGAKLRPIVFLRDDIYSLITNNDRNKWDDLRLNLNWDIDNLKKLIAFRVFRASDQNSTSSNFNIMASQIFKTQSIRYGTNRRRLRPIVNHMLDRTLLRPRDIISYFRECAKIAFSRNMPAIPPSVIKEAEEQYSRRFRQELVDEMQSIIPDISNVFDAISVIRKQLFSLSEIKRAIDRSGSNLGGLTTEKVVELLFHFSVIGNVPSQHSDRIFKYKNEHAKMSERERFVIHPGLMKALEIT